MHRVTMFICLSCTVCRSTHITDEAVLLLLLLLLPSSLLPPRHVVCILGAPAAAMHE